jgi:hypothetical protein
VGFRGASADLIRKAIREGGLTVVAASEVVGTLPPDTPEREFTAAVLDLAGACGWLRWHPLPLRTARGWATGTQGDRGWPDVAAVRGGRLVVAELKAADGRLTYEQMAWLAELRKVGGGVEVYEWRPSDWPRVVEVLR